MPFVNRAFIIVTTFVAVLDKIGSSLIDFQNGSGYLNSSYQDFIVHGPILILVPIRGTKSDCCELIAHKVEIENLYDNLPVGVAFKIFFSCKSAGDDL